MRPVLRAIAVTAIVILAVRCSPETETDTGAIRYAPGASSQQRAVEGAKLFKDRNFGDAGIACADCHTEYPDSLQKVRIMPAHSILGAAGRQETWYGEFSGDQLTPTAAGAAKCALVYQLRGKTLDEALSPDEASALMEFYRFVSTGNEARKLELEALSYPGDPEFQKETIMALVDSLNELRGDEARGEALFQKACAFCHSGSADAVAPNPRMLRRYASKVFLYVRAGKSNMPFFSYDKLSDQDVADIKEWIQRGAR